MIGTSGPSISTTTLSTLSPRNVASRCSAVEQSGPEASPSTVANSVAVTARTSARISRSIEPSADTRWKTMPASSSAGFIVSVTGIPEWTPTPEMAIWSRRVVCLAPFIDLVSASSQASRAVPSQAPTEPYFGLQIGTPEGTGGNPQGLKKSLSPLRPYRRLSPTHAFLPTVTLFCRNFCAPGHLILGFTLPGTPLQSRKWRWQLTTECDAVKICSSSMS